MRLFIAIEMPKEIVNLFKRLQKEFSGLGRISLTKEYHCTLKFLGEVPEDKLGDVKDKLRTVQFEPFEATLDGLGVFPNENYVRVIWVGLKGDVKELQEKVEESLTGLFEKGKRFHPHITLGRVKFLEDKIKFKEKLKTKIPKEKFIVKEFKLIQSKLTPQGPEYDVLETYSS